MRADLVYFAEKDGLVKIGYSADPSRRVRQLQARLLVVLPGGARIESWMHRQFVAYRAHGEWFHPGIELVALIEGLTGEPSRLPQEYADAEFAQRHARVRAGNQVRAAEVAALMVPGVLGPDADRQAALIRGNQLDRFKAGIPIAEAS